MLSYLRQGIWYRLWQISEYSSCFIIFLANSPILDLVKAMQSIMIGQIVYQFDQYKSYAVNLKLQQMIQPKQIEQIQDGLTNQFIKSKGEVKGITKFDYKLNYDKIYDNPKSYRISYIDSLENLEKANEIFCKRIRDRNPDYNFFLDDGDDPSEEKPLSQELYKAYCQSFRKGQIFAYTIKNTWTKGKDFFFIGKGTVLKITHVYEDRVFADVSLKDKIGLMKFEELKIILTRNQDQED